MDTSDLVVGGKQKSTIREISRNCALFSLLGDFLSRFNVFAKYHPYMIGKIDAVETISQTAVVIDAKTQRRIMINYDEGIERVLTTNKSKFVEIIGKIRIDRHYNPISISLVSDIIPVDTGDIGITEVLPSFLVMTSCAEPAIKVELNEDKRFYSAELENLNIFACGYTRAELKENLKESVDICWDEFVREDDSDFAVSAQNLRRMLLSTCREVKPCD